MVKIVNLSATKDPWELVDNKNKLQDLQGEQTVLETQVKLTANVSPYLLCKYAAVF